MVARKKKFIPLTHGILAVLLLILILTSIILGMVMHFGNIVSDLTILALIGCAMITTMGLYLSLSLSKTLQIYRRKIKRIRQRYRLSTVIFETCSQILDGIFLVIIGLTITFLIAFLFRIVSILNVLTSMYDFIFLLICATIALETIVITAHARLPLERKTGKIRDIFFTGLTTLSLGIIAFVLLMGLSLRTIPIAVLFGLSIELLCEITAIGVRENILLPSIITSALERRYYLRKRATARIIYITIISFILLFFSVLILIAMRVGAGALITGIRENPIVVSILVIEIAIVTTILFKVIGGILRETRVEKRKLVERDIYKTAILMISGILTLTFILYILLIQTGILYYPPSIIKDLSIFALLSAVAPYSFYEARRLSKIRRMEEELPYFLRDLAESSRAGMTLFDAIRIASHGKYGSLTPEIKRMARQISWGISVNDALTMFADRIGTPLVKRSVSLIIEASSSGGNIADVLTAAADDTREIKLLEKERKINMSTYVVVVYVAFFVFLAVILILATLFLPEAVRVSQEVPIAGESEGVSIPKINPVDFLNIYFAASLVQGFGGGLVAGILSDGKMSSGLKHSTIMIIATYVLFKFLVGM